VVRTARVHVGLGENDIEELVHFRHLELIVIEIPTTTEIDKIEGEGRREGGRERERGRGGEGREGGRTRK